LFSLFAVALGIAWPVEAQTAFSGETYKIARAPGPIVIDGDLSDAGWRDATRAGFELSEPTDGRSRSVRRSSREAVRADLVHFAQGPLDRDALPKPVQHGELPSAAPGERSRRQDHERDPQVVVVRELHPLRHDADDDDGAAVDADGASQNVPVAVVAPLPDAVPEDRDRLRSIHVVGLLEITPEDGVLVDG
jgi:hypothetical protein